jgi:hypothetical protein
MLAYDRCRALLGVAVSLFLLAGCSKIKQMAGGGDGANGGATAEPLAAGGPSLQGFEGEIGVQLKGGPKENPPNAITPLTLLVSGVKIRADLPSNAETMKTGKAYVILDAPEKKISAVLDDRKEVVSLSIDHAADQLKGMTQREHPTAAPGAAKDPPPKIVKTDHKDTIAGYVCQDWDIVSHDGSKATVCFTEQETPWFKIPAPALPPDYPWMSEFLDGKHLPLRAVMFDKTGVEQQRVEVTKFERKSLAPQLFEVPAAYKVVDLQQIIQEFIAEAMAKQGLHGGALHIPGGMPPGLPPGAMPMLAGSHPKLPGTGGSISKPQAPPKQR